MIVVGASAIKLPVVVKGYPIVAGIISAIGSALLSVEFYQALIIALITGVLAGVGTVIAAVFAARIARHAIEPLRENVEHLKRAQGLTRRATDRPDEDA